MRARGCPSSQGPQQGVRDAVAHAHQRLGRVTEVHAVAAQRVQQRARGARVADLPDRVHRLGTHPTGAVLQCVDRDVEPVDVTAAADEVQATDPSRHDRAVRPARGVAQRALLTEQLDQLLGRLTAHLAEQLHDQVVQVAPAAAGRRAEAAQGLAVLGVLAGRDADDEGAQRCEPALGGALAQAALDLDPDDGDRHGQAGHPGDDRGEGDQTGQGQVERHGRGRARIPLTRCTSSRGLKGLTM